jgi:hypothetical protein
MISPRRLGMGGSSERNHHAAAPTSLLSTRLAAATARLRKSGRPQGQCGGWASLTSLDIFVLDLGGDQTTGLGA